LSAALSAGVELTSSKVMPSLCLHSQFIQLQNMQSKLLHKIYAKLCAEACFGCKIASTWTSPARLVFAIKLLKEAASFLIKI